MHNSTIMALEYIPTKGARRSRCKAIDGAQIAKEMANTDGEGFDWDPSTSGRLMPSPPTHTDRLTAVLPKRPTALIPVPRGKHASNVQLQWSSGKKLVDGWGEGRSPAYTDLLAEVPFKSTCHCIVVRKYDTEGDRPIDEIPVHLLKLSWQASASANGVGVCRTGRLGRKSGSWYEEQAAAVGRSGAGRSAPERAPLTCGLTTAIRDGMRFSCLTQH